MCPFSCIPLVIYLLLDKQPIKDITQETSQYQPLGTSKNKEKRQSISSCNEFIVIYYTFIPEFILQISLAAILPTVTFKSAPISPRDHYQYYRLVSNVGLMLGGVPTVVPSLGQYLSKFLFKNRHICSIIVLNISVLILLLSISWFHFLENIYVLLSLCFLQGILLGFAYVHGFSLAAHYFHDSLKLGSMLAYMLLSASIARITAALLGMFVEQYVRQHCMNRLMLGRFCLARSSSPSAWSTLNGKT